MDIIVQLQLWDFVSIQGFCVRYLQHLPVLSLSLLKILSVAFCLEAESAAMLV